MPVESERPGNRATITWILISLLLIAAILQRVYAGTDVEIFRTFGLVPVRLLSPESWSLIGPAGQLMPMVSHAVVHDGLTHVGLNLCFLLVFGPPVERWLGTGIYILTLFILTIGPALGDVLIRSHSVVPMVGASGLVAGLMGLYWVCYPRSNLRALLPLAVPISLPVPVSFLMCAWLGLQSLLAYGQFGGSASIAWWAHIVGFALGICLGILMRRMNLGCTIAKQPNTH